MRALLRGDQHRRNISAAQLAWGVNMLQQMIVSGVAQGIAAAFGAQVDMGPLTPKRLKKLLRSVPGYQEEDEE